MKAVSLLAAVMFGSLAGLGVEFLQPRLGAAQALLYFPPTLAYQAGLPQQEDQPEEGKIEPMGWASDILTSHEAVEAVCKRVERSSETDKAEYLRSAVLLLEKKRIELVPLPDNFLRLRVQAETPEVAEVLCEGLLAYLAFRAKIPLEDPDAAKVRSLEQEVRGLEKTVSSDLWRELAFTGEKKPGSSGLAASDMTALEYRGALHKYKQQSALHFFRESRLAAATPSHIVIEPPAGSRVAVNWRRGLWWGGLAAGVLWLLVRSVRRVFQEQVGPGRTHPP